MKVTFEFDTESENFIYQDLERYKSVDKLCWALSDLADKIRSWTKYDERNEIPIDEIHETFYDILRNRNIDLGELIY